MEAKNKIWIVVAIAVVFALLVAQCIPKGTSIDVEAAKTKVTVGMTQQQVIDALGEPTDPVRSFQTSEGNTESLMVYWDNQDENKMLRITLTNGIVDWVVIQESSD